MKTIGIKDELMSPRVDSVKDVGRAGRVTGGASDLTGTGCWKLLRGEGLYGYEMLSSCSEGSSRWP